MADLEAQLALRDETIAELKAQVQQLSQELQRTRAPGSAVPLLGKGNALGGPRGGLAQTTRPPRMQSPGRLKMPPSPGRTASPRAMTARASSPIKRNASGQPAFFHASQRGGPLTEPLPHRGLSQKERENPYDNLRGPSLLHRPKHGAKKSEWERFKDGAGAGGGNMVNAFDDDNPFNDPIKYWPFKGWAFPPTDYIGPDDERETDDLSSITSTGNALKLTFVYGYRGRRATAPHVPPHATSMCGSMRMRRIISAPTNRRAPSPHFSRNHTMRHATWQTFASKPLLQRRGAHRVPHSCAGCRV